MLSDSLAKAGSNRAELEKVIEHYSSLTDSLKLKAATFLIENMPGHGTLCSKAIYDIQEQLGAYPHNRIDVVSLNHLWDSLSNYNKPIFKEDLTNITADFLIKHIDHAFKVWNSVPWKNEITFDLFCNYILPYRFENEILSNNCSDILYNMYYPLVRNAKTMKEAYECLHKYIWEYLPSSSSKFPYILNPLSILHQQKATCLQRCVLFGSIMRAVGLPAAIDDVGFWANYSNGSHTWTSLVTLQGTYSIYRDETESKINNKIDATLFEINHDIPKNYKLCTSFKKRCSKIWRSTFKNNNNTFDTNLSYRFNFNSNFKIDVSHEYGFKGHINLKLNKTLENLILCTYVTGADWQPVTRGLVLNSQATFNSLGDSVIYIPAYMSNNSIQTIGYPIMLSNGRISTLKPNMNDVQTVYLTRKYPITGKWMNEWAPLVGGVFEVSNDRNFESSINIHHINEMPIFFNEIHIELDKPYRYFRYKPNNQCYTPLAEIELYNSFRKIKPIIAYGDVTNINNCIDGDTFSKPDNEKGYMITLDLGHPEIITTFRYFPWNDGNFVTLNHDYELLYFDKKWISIGRKTAKDYFISFDNVPKNALLLLKDHTSGKEERPFTYENGEQIWW